MCEELTFKNSVIVVREEIVCKHFDVDYFRGYYYLDIWASP